MRKAYHYFYQAGIRCQLSFGGTMGKYVEWKASLPLVALLIWWTLIGTVWLRTVRKIVLGHSYLPPFLIVGAVMVVHLGLLGTKDTRESYRQEFHSWPQRRRRICDSFVAAFYLISIVLFFWSAVESKKILGIS